MGDLIIKPESGGSIKIQNSGGIDTLVSDNSGNITLSGSANNLGTVTAGNISHADIVYPAGHVIQVINEQITGSYTVSSGGTTEVHESAAITMITGSKWLILVTASLSGNPDITFKVQHKLSSGGTYVNTFSHNVPSGSNSVATDLFAAHQNFSAAQATSQSTSGCSMVGAYSSTYIRFKCFIGSRTGGGALNRRVQDNNWAGHSFLTLTEIAQ
jgi:hypothetical protein